MSQQRQNKILVGANNADTTYTKIFVGGLAWQSQRDSLQRYFEQFGEILEAVVILDKNTGRSKGYGFVTFKDPDSAMRACQNHYPLIDGRRANCNLAAFGAQKNYPTTPQRGMEKFRPSLIRTMAPAPSQGTTSPYFHPQVPHYAFPHSAYGYPNYYPQDMFTMNYYNAYGGGQQLPYYYAYVAAGSPGAYNYYGHDGPLQIPKMTQHPHLPPTKTSHRSARNSL
ncbi:probable RNA-binding protein ARP1 isoform X2 [Alnus glutinosa]|uniref:probable RNA-binding protein ARP1 isoform X2 n=1 Tax=Alnus glutinosa TaxID=3517 RepID=UPI002D7844C8|nr:probable RNA-binding protein ARP1 isoform X2 [Alnus glutinosa]